MPFKQMENIATFLAAVMKLPTFRSFDLFSTVDLYEGKNMAQVTRCILACKRFADRESMIRGMENMAVTDANKSDMIETDVIKLKEDLASEREQEQAMPQEPREPQEKKQFETCQEPEVSQEPQEILSHSSSIDDIFQDVKSPQEPLLDPEIVLIDSPGFADDESDPIISEDRDIVEEYETFTQDNPGTFEIQVSH